jgi:hypothetical protein
MTVWLWSIIRARRRKCHLGPDSLAGKERRMEVIRRAALALAAVILAAVGLAPAALATAPATGTGAFAPSGPPTTLSTRTADGNTIVTQVQKFIDTGILTGTEIDTVTFTFHPNGSFNFRADVAYTGAVAGRQGTLSQHFEGTGDATSFHGQLQTVSGTGALANLHGQGSFEGSSITGAGTYTFHYHFDP